MKIQIQPFAPAVAAGGLVAAISAGVLGGWRIVDCVRFQTRAGQCDETIGANVGSVIAAAGALAAATGAWNTINPSLRVDTQLLSPLRAIEPLHRGGIEPVGLMPYRRPQEDADE